MVKGATARGESVSFVVNSGSMRPFLRKGDVVSLAEAREYRAGDIVLAKCEKIAGSAAREESPEGAQCRTCVLHTVMRREGETLILAGAANIYQRERARVADVAARVVSVERKARKPGAALRTISAISPLRRFLLRSWPSAPLLRRILLRLLSL